MRKFFQKAFKTGLFLIPILFASTTETVFSADKYKSKPAKEDDLKTYVYMGGRFICNATKTEIEYPKAFGVAVVTNVQIIEAKHGGKVAFVSKERLSREQLFRSSELQLASATLRICPENVPENVKKDVKKAEEAISKSMEKDKKKNKNRR